jgi:hypothetical protein
VPSSGLVRRTEQNSASSSVACVCLRKSLRVLPASCGRSIDTSHNPGIGEKDVHDRTVAAAGAWHETIVTSGPFCVGKRRHASCDTDIHKEHTAEAISTVPRAPIFAGLRCSVF